MIRHNYIDNTSFGKLLKWHLWEYDQLRLKCYRLHDSEIELVTLRGALNKIGRDDNTISLKFLSHDVKKTSWDRNFKEIVLSSRTTYLLLWYMFMLKWPRVYTSFLSKSTFSKVMFQIPRKLVWLRGLYIIPTVKGVVLGNRIWKKMFSTISEKKSFCT